MSHNVIEAETGIDERSIDMQGRRIAYYLVSVSVCNEILDDMK